MLLYHDRCGQSFDLEFGNELIVVHLVREGRATKAATRINFSLPPTQEGGY